METRQLLTRNAPHPVRNPLDDLPSQRGPDPDALPRTLVRRPTTRRETRDALPGTFQESRLAGRGGHGSGQTTVDDDFKACVGTRSVPTEAADRH